MNEVNGINNINGTDNAKGIKKIILGLTGASGGVYFLRLADFLRRQEIKLHIVASENGEKVLKYETGADLRKLVATWNKEATETGTSGTKTQILSGSIKAQIIPESAKAQIIPGSTKAQIIPDSAKANIILEDNGNLFSAIASGSCVCDAMAIVPCSMSTVARIASGISDTLLCRAADVMIKEQRKIIIVPRETPLSQIHLKNLYRLSKCGVTVLPAMPAFYGVPGTVAGLVDFMAGKILDSIGIPNSLYKRWDEVEITE